MCEIYMKIFEIYMLYEMSIIIILIYIFVQLTKHCAEGSWYNEINILKYEYIYKYKFSGLSETVLDIHFLKKNTYCTASTARHRTP